MPRNPEEERVRSRVRKYLDEAVLSKDGRSLNILAVASFVPCSRTTIYNYGLDKEITRIAKKLKNDKRKKDESDLEKRLRKANEDAAGWKKKYLTVVEKLVQIEYHLKGHPSINLDEIYATPIPVPDRSKPYQSISRRSRKRG